MFTRVTKAFALLVCLVAFSSQAQAVTIAGVEYDKILSFETDKRSDRLGYWISMKKFYTYDNKPNSPVGVEDVTVFDTALNGHDISEVYLMGTTTNATFDSQINGGVVGLYDDDGVALISGTYASNGLVDSTHKRGRKGQLNISGLFTVNSGKLFDLGLVQGPLYVEFLFDKVVGLGHNDIHSADGTINFYTPGGATEIPEPATVALLASSLFGAARLRKKKAE